MYHALLPPPTLANVPGQPKLPDVHIPAALFEQHLAWLHAEGYVTVTAAEFYRRWQARELPAHLVALTFDDGYRSLLDYAAPALKKYGFVATLFLTTDFVGQPDFSTDAAFAQGAPPADRPLSWPEVRALQAAGWAIEAHSLSHPPHAGLPAAELRQELVVSRQVIAEQLGTPPDFYAFPYGSYDRATLRALLDAGYAAGFSVHDGPPRAGRDRRRLPRAEINTRCTPAVFARLVRTGYASAGARWRAALRDTVFHFPLVKDWVSG